MIGHLIMGASMTWLAVNSSLWAASVVFATWGSL
jgi:hypothetical protein